MNQGPSEEPPKSFEARLQQAKSKTDSYKAEEASRRDLPKEGWGMAFRLGTELVVALAVSVFIGWALDQWLETKPWLMILFFFLGSAAGMLNVYRLVNGVGYNPTYGPTGEEKIKGDTNPGAGDQA